MKLIVLVESNSDSFDKMIDLVDNKTITIIDTERCDELHEYKYIADAIRDFSLSNSEILLGKFSGRESILRELGDERPEMIVALSSNKNSRHYAGKLADAFLNLVSAFEKETILA